MRVDREKGEHGWDDVDVLRQEDGRVIVISAAWMRFVLPVFIWVGVWDEECISKEVRNDGVRIKVFWGP